MQLTNIDARLQGQTSVKERLNNVWSNNAYVVFHLRKWDSAHIDPETFASLSFKTLFTIHNKC